MDRFHYYLQVGFDAIQSAPVKDKAAVSLTLFFAWLSAHLEGIQALLGVLGSMGTLVWLVFRILAANEDWKTKRRMNK